ncbi:WD repeat-containing protein 74-like [Plakobranchus ocellatus]|uniref:WD repeat-containing protein 74-like n=1 Tax=Plakobranchus ocellatus TaxID=259542 RepID=A0AAV3XYG7_9GAST|nr:WD repeat-containing protein 74-like [Plakobranchus ocellatus]
MAASVSNMSGTEENQASRIMDLPTINRQAFQHCPYDIYAGCVTGYVKGCHMSSKSHQNLNELNNVSANHEIKSMCWNDFDESVIFTGQRDGSIFRYSITNEDVVPVPIEFSGEMGIFRNIKSHDDLIISAFSKGIVKCNRVTMENSNLESQLYVDIDAGTDLYCMDHNRHFPSSILTGGKENPLKIWDISAPKEPIFSAKNVKNDWLNLTVPVWVTKAEFYFQSDKVITGTAKAHIRLYDPSTPQRRPVIDIESKETSPITALSVRPNSNFQVVAGTGKGSLVLVDLRKKSVVRNYKGVKGGVTDIKFHPVHPYFVTSSVDRHIYCFDPDVPKQAKCSSVYLYSQINCLLFSSLWSPSDTVKLYDKSDVTTENILDKNASSPHNEFDDEEDTDEVWKSLDVVQTKRKHSSSNEALHKLKRKKKKS